MSGTAVLKDSTPTRPRHERHRPEKNLLYPSIDRHSPEFLTDLEEQGKPLPHHRQKEFDEFLKCGRLEHGFLRVQCRTCHKERRVAFSCERRGFCPGCGARRRAESAALRVDDVLPHEPMRQWVLRFPYPLRCLFASRPELMGKVPGIVYRAIEAQRVIDKILAHLKKKDGLPSRQDALPETRAPPQTSLFG